MSSETDTLETDNAPSADPDNLVPPISIVPVLTYKVLNRAVGLPKSYVSEILGNHAPAIVEVLPTYKLPPSPIPPATCSAPELVEVAFVVLYILKISSVSMLVVVTVVY